MWLGKKVCCGLCVYVLTDVCATHNTLNLLLSVSIKKKKVMHSRAKDFAIIIFISKQKTGYQATFVFAGNDGSCATVSTLYFAQRAYIGCRDFHNAGHILRAHTRIMSFTCSAGMSLSSLLSLLLYAAVTWPKPTRTCVDHDSSRVVQNSLAPTGAKLFWHHPWTVSWTVTQSS